MKKYWGVIVVFLALGFVAGLAANRLLFERHDRENPIAPQASVKGNQEPAAKKKTSLNHKEAILKQMIESLRPINGSSIYNIGICRYYRPFIEEYLGRDAHVRMLEIGPGINLGTGLIFAMTGVKKYYGLDIYRDPELLAAPQYESIVELLQRVAPEQIKTPADAIMTVGNGQVAFDQDRVEYLYPHQSYDIPLPDGSLDFVFSHSTFEHIADPMKTVEAIKRVLRKGGITAHHIDLRDHRDFSKPLEFLKVDSATWKSNYKDPAEVHLYMNRWRTSDFKAALEKNGFQILKIEPTATCPVTEEMRRSFQPEFQKKSLEDLSIINVLIVARKP